MVYTHWHHIHPMNLWPMSPIARYQNSSTHQMMRASPIWKISLKQMGLPTTSDQTWRAMRRNLWDNSTPSHPQIVHTATTAVLRLLWNSLSISVVNHSPEIH